MRLTALLGRPVHDEEGRALGRVADVAVSLDAPYPQVTSLLVRRRRERARAPWASVRELGPAAVVLRAAPAADGTRAPGELWLGRDVLDAQVVDVTGHRVRRVGDVELHSHGGRLEAVAVDVSLAAVTRRLGLGRLVAHRPEPLLDWHDLHIASTPGHTVQLDSPAAAMHRLGARDLAHLVASLPPTRAHQVLERVGPARAAAARAARPPRRPRFPHLPRRRAHA